MKICMVVPEAKVKGGIAAVVNGYRSNLERDKYAVTYVESYCDGGKAAKLMKAVKGYLAFACVLIFNKPDVVHIHSSFGPSFYRKIPFIYMAAAKKIPIINHIHGAEFGAFYDDASLQKKERIKKVYNKCTMLIALSDEWKDDLKKIVPENKIEILENYCMIPGQYAAGDVENKEKMQILFLGEIGVRKGCFDIPHILAKMEFEQCDADFVFAGDGKQEDVDKIKQMICEMGLKDKVTFTGWVRGAEKDRILRESDIFLLPSYHEGMPMAILDAMSYAMAIVSTTVGGIGRLIKDGENGYLCKPGDIDRLADKLLVLLNDPVQVKAFGKKSRGIAEECYGLENHIDKLLRIYDRVGMQR